ncbi:hypothetical protein [Chroococcidiopsis sp.]|uniref:hypothetical protein n=1 Tax=Chroococcidiopsis sp. TaxID=3088168 RepID=UPI003F2D446C
MVSVLADREFQYSAYDVSKSVKIHESTLNTWVRMNMLVEGYHYKTVPSRYGKLRRFNLKAVSDYVGSRKGSKLNDSISLNEFVRLPEKVLKDLRSDTGQVTELMRETMKNIGVELNMNWEQTRIWLDKHYPGWRGYEVTYKDGSKG